MKKYLRGCLKLVFVISYPILIIGTIAFAALFLFRNNELDQIKNQFNIAQDNINKGKEENQITIENLQDSFDSLNKEITQLKSENAALKEEADAVKAQGYGQIRGSTVPLIVGNSSFSQYQLVCAENVLNKNLQYCKTVPAIEKDFALLVPAGTYQLFAKVVTSDTQFSDYKAYYTEYIQCVREKRSENCNTSLSSKNIQVVIKAGETISNIDPVDWSGIK